MAYQGRVAELYSVEGPVLEPLSLAARGSGGGVCYDRAFLARSSRHTLFYIFSETSYRVEAQGRIFELFLFVGKPRPGEIWTDRTSGSES